MAPKDDLTAERAAAERVIRECPEVWNRVCYLSDCTFQALATRILEYGQQTRQEALRDVLSDLDSLHWKDHWYADQLRRKINERLL